ncbi:MAG: hypothetical protein B6U68_02865 [Candidatus Aenigmarchaeota archaeon ex4484_14]|nr:MAG: hypothetical protein B6U68_02865 [Candidatus Aenigmarchaeota archaeon ex4484_14]
MKGNIFLVIILMLFLVLAVSADPSYEKSGTITISVADIGTTLSFKVINCTTCGFTSYYNEETTTTTTTLSNLTKDMSILNFPKKIEIVQGESKNITLNVKNTGDETLNNITFSVSGIDSSWYSVGNISVIYAGLTESTTLKITVPSVANLSIKDITITATSASKKTSTATTQLKILPNEDTKAMIRKLYNIYKAKLESLNQTINELASKGKNVRTVKQIFGEAESKLNLAKKNIDDNNYYDAYFNLMSAKDKIIELEKEIERVRRTFAWWVYPIIGAIVLIVVFVIYLFLPEKEEEYEYVEEVSE